MKPWYKSKKLWVGMATVLSTVGAYLNGEANLATLIAAIGSVVALAIGLSDLGKGDGPDRLPPPPPLPDVEG